ncbi:hypothetical protein [Nonomuraea fuscirosea]|uniref:hypothetical protein n=1 Tax=Nonomuraea fuscirosea TaxID=1291556 RepID=UPI0033CA8EAA
MNRRTFREELGQLRHHRAFRIPPPTWDEPVMAQLAALLDSPRPPEPLDEKSLATAATHLWRAERRLAAPGADAAGRQTARHLRTTRAALAEAGLVLQDHDGEAFHSGRSIEVLLFQDDPSLSAETVLETVRPSIYLRERHIQLGQVIVGRPTREDLRNGHA